MILGGRGSLHGGDETGWVFELGRSNHLAYCDLFVTKPKDIPFSQIQIVVQHPKNELSLEVTHPARCLKTAIAIK